MLDMIGIWHNYEGNAINEMISFFGIYPVKDNPFVNI